MEVFVWIVVTDKGKLPTPKEKDAQKKTEEDVIPKEKSAPDMPREIQG